MTALHPKVRKVIAERMDEWVVMAERCVEETGVAEKESKLQESQLRNLQNLAAATESVKALENFVRYQMGRHEEWRHNKKFGDQVLHDLAVLAERAKEIAAATPDKAYAVHLELIRLYLGFLVRAFVAKRKEED